MENKNCLCNSEAQKTVFACSGAADLGRISDLVARKLQNDKQRQMKCLAFVGAGIQEMIDTVKDSDILLIDGCELDCGRICLENNGMNDFIHLRLTDLGYVKGSTPVHSKVVNELAEHANSL